MELNSVFNTFTLVGASAGAVLGFVGSNLMGFASGLGGGPPPSVTKDTLLTAFAGAAIGAISKLAIDGLGNYLNFDEATKELASQVILGSGGVLAGAAAGLFIGFCVAIGAAFSRSNSPDLKHYVLPGAILGGASAIAIPILFESAQKLILN
jgi:hypothetical protein